MLEQQIHVAQSLERLLKKRTNVELFPPLPSKRVRMSTPLDNPDLYDELDEDTLALYQSLNEVIASRFPDGETTFRDVDVKNDAITRTSLEAMDVRVVPFDYLMTATASWHRFTVGSDLARQFVLEEVKLTEDRVSMDFKGALRPDIPSELHGRIVMCQFVETDRIVIVWSALINPLKYLTLPSMAS
ncbi:hypothetical protein Poli38472_004859 [Pythium oligandrum]|uniref:Uncharacterized protein n=1 Tax=Pythium oligandrum TaxID=41045 RepID=A0A8K1FDU4_PYTOL|nr:hypothetical protein Poli38472_004859 [Pythium oligandrum]|eukprot:TMW59790.1 hypothetical protein Poli38472_004859 [Pythium oligandrum]